MATRSFFNTSITSILIILLFKLQLTTQDIYADVEVMINLLTRQGCRILDLALLPPSVVSDLPQLISEEYVLDFRKSFEDLARLSLNRAIFFSYVLQRIQYAGEPRLRYYLYSLFTDLATYDDAEFSGIIYDENKVKLRNSNGELLQSRFAPCATRALNTSSRFITVTDCNAEPASFHMSESIDMALSLWRYNWTSKTNVKLYNVKRFIDNDGGETINFYGPSKNLRVKWSAPYLVCSKFPKWYLTVTSPIIRHDPPLDPSFVAASMVSVKLDRAPINQCSGAKTTNVFANTDRCKKETTKCEPIPGYGFQRGGYVCKCKPGYVFPEVQGVAFNGRDLELANDEVYKNESNFNCILQNIDKKSRDLSAENSTKSKVTEVFNILKTISDSDCSSSYNKFIIKKGLKYLIHSTFVLHFHSELLSTWRFSLFLSNYLQNNEAYLQKSKLKERVVFGEELIGELLAIYFSHENILRLAMTFDKKIFPKQLLKNLYVGENDGQVYINISTSSNFTQSQEYKEKMNRLQPESRPLSKFSGELRSRADPRVFRMTSLGQKTFQGTTFADSLRIDEPYFYCHSNRSLIWADLPFYKKKGYAGIISVALPLDEIDVDQCDSSPHEYFRGTHHCDKTTTCIPVKGQGFQPGGYKCICRIENSNQAVNNNTLREFDGFEVEAEYEKMSNGLSNNYANLNCMNVKEEVLPKNKNPAPDIDESDHNSDDDDDVGLDDIAVFVSSDKMPVDNKYLTGEGITIETLDKGAWKDIIGQYSPHRHWENEDEPTTTAFSKNSKDDLYYNDYSTDNNYNSEYNTQDKVDNHKGYWVKFKGKGKASNERNDYKKTTETDKYIILSKLKKSKHPTDEIRLRSEPLQLYSSDVLNISKENPNEIINMYMTPEILTTMTQKQEEISNKFTQMPTTQLKTPTNQMATPITQMTTRTTQVTRRTTQVTTPTTQVTTPTSQLTTQTITQEATNQATDMTTPDSTVITTLKVTEMRKNIKEVTKKLMKDVSKTINIQKTTVQPMKDSLNTIINDEEYYYDDADEKDDENIQATTAGSYVTSEDSFNKGLELGKRKGDLGESIKSWLDRYKEKEELGMLRSSDSSREGKGDIDYLDDSEFTIQSKDITVNNLKGKHQSFLDDYDLPAKDDKTEKTIVVTDDVETDNNSSERKSTDDYEYVSTSDANFEPNDTKSKSSQYNLARFARIFLTVN